MSQSNKYTSIRSDRAVDWTRITTTPMPSHTNFLLNVPRRTLLQEKKFQNLIFKSAMSRGRVKVGWFSSSGSSALPARYREDVF